VNIYAVVEGDGGEAVESKELHEKVIVVSLHYLILCVKGKVSRNIYFISTAAHEYSEFRWFTKLAESLMVQYLCTTLVDSLVSATSWSNRVADPYPVPFDPWIRDPGPQPILLRAW
jgi:hypothetical protein